MLTSDKKGSLDVALPYLPYILLFFYYLAAHLVVDWQFGDYTDLMASYQNHGLIEYLALRWTKWTSRIILEGITMQLVPATWAIVDSAAFVLAYHSISVMAELGNGSRAKWVLFGLVLCYPFVDQASAGWIMTTAMYVFPLALLLYVFSVVARVMRGESVPVWRAVLMVLAAIVAGNSEQAMALMLCADLVLIAWEWAHGRRHLLMFILLAVALASAAVVMVCPGNAVRLEYETGYWLPEFASYSPVKKLCIGVAATIDRCIYEASVPTLVLTVLLAFCVWMRPSSKMWQRVVVLLPLATIVIASFLTSFAYVNFPYIVEKLLSRPSLEENGLSLGPLLTDFFFLTVLLASVVAAFGTEPRGLLVLAIVLAGLCSRFMMGFSPTVYASGDRTFIFMDFAFIIVSIFAYLDVRHRLNGCAAVCARVSFAGITTLSALNSLLSAAFFHW